MQICYALCRLIEFQSANVSIKGGRLGQTRCSNMAADSKNWEKPDRYMTSFTAKNTFTENYGCYIVKYNILVCMFHGYYG